jgi:hypothetical protein
LLLRICIICSLLLAGAVVAAPQTVQQRTKPRTSTPAPKQQTTPPVLPDRAKEPAPEESPDSDEPAQEDLETLKISTNLVTVPVIATTVEGNYIPDLRQDEFSISEDGKNQEIAFFATVSAPFNVVLLLDTSASTEEKIGLIRRSAATFVEQLQNTDRVKVISFDSQVRELSEFTNDRAILRNAIYKTAPGQGTRLYDAIELALSSLRTIRGRKAVVVFTDGVDWHSADANFEGSLRGLDVEGVIVYPIRFETRADTERIVRDGNDAPSLPTIGVIRDPSAGGSTPTTFPSDEPSIIPNRPPKTGPFGLPTAAEIMKGRRQRDRDSYPNPDQGPPSGPTRRPDDDPSVVGVGRPEDRDIRDPSRRSRRNEDSVTAMLDSLYSKGDSYLLELAKKSGGRVVRADSVSSLPEAFAKIAAELRTQYAIGYYPANKTRDGEYRTIKVATSRKSVVVRSRPGYRAPKGG